MADATDWRSSVSASERYDNIQRLTKSPITARLSKSAFAIENEAYTTASSKEEYEAACSLSGVAAEPASTSPKSFPPETDDRSSEPGITIGHYQNCHYVSSGVTAEVYRSQARALKVIVETHNIEPHNPQREARILESLRNAPNVIPLLETFRDQDQRFVLVFPYMPLTLAHLLDQADSPLQEPLIRNIFTCLFRALDHLHKQGIIHRDVKPSAVLLSSPLITSTTTTTTAYLSDFGTAWHPSLSPPTEPPTAKILDVGTGPYRAPEALFGDRAYGPPLDLWAAGALLAECCARPRPRPLFDSPPAHEDGSQLGLILSIFRTLGSPTAESWPEARGFRTPPFEMYQVFEGRSWEEVLPGVGEEWRELVAGLVRYESGERVSAGEALNFRCMKGEGGEGDS
ncbi:hypothetical protein VTK56DRAFT_4875 [Thermocarpiscus australiensis]